MREQLRSEIETAREELFALCGRLVAAPSVNPPGDTRAVADVVAGYLRGRGLSPELVAAVPEMPSVLASVEGGAPGPHRSAPRIRPSRPPRRARADLQAITFQALPLRWQHTSTAENRTRG